MITSKEQFEQLFNQFKMEALSYIKSRAPRRSGRLKANISYSEISGGFAITIDISYAVYTEEQWISPRWNGRENPNLYWIKESVGRLAQRFANKLKGVVIYNVN